MTDRLALDRWLEGTGSDHPIRREIRLGGMDDYLDELERLLTTLDRAAPTRLAGKRRDFRGLTDRERWRDLLSELLVARWLVRQGVGFDFGGPGTAQPDLVLSEYDFGIEVTRRSRNGAVALRRSLYRGLASVTPRPQPVVTLDAQPLAIWEGILAQINDEALATLRSGGRHLQAVVRPARDGHPAATADIDLFGGPSAYPTIRYSSPATTLAVTMLDIEDLVMACLEDSRKTKQGAAMPCLLVVDGSSLVSAVWLRAKGAWANRLARILRQQHTFVAVALMFASVWEPPQLALGIGPNADDDVRRAIIGWSEQMGMEIVGEDLIP
jgi:hypothetical protein